MLLYKKLLLMTFGMTLVFNKLSNNDTCLFRNYGLDTATSPTLWNTPSGLLTLPARTVGT